MSDGTGRTAESVSLAAMRQFLPGDVSIVQEVLPRIVNLQQISQIMSAMTVYKPCIIAYTIVVQELRDKLKEKRRIKKLKQLVEEASLGDADDYGDPI